MPGNREANDLRDDDARNSISQRSMPNERAASSSPFPMR